MIQIDEDVFVYSVLGVIPCRDDGCASGDRPRFIPERCADRFTRRFGEDKYCEWEDAALEGAVVDVVTLVIVKNAELLHDPNGVPMMFDGDCHVWFANFCDKCGRTWMATLDDEDGDALDMVVCPLAEGNHRASDANTYGATLQRWYEPGDDVASWADLVRFVKQQYGYEIIESAEHEGKQGLATASQASHEACERQV